MAIALLVTTLAPVDWVAAGMFPFRPGAAVSMIDSMRAGVLAGALLSSVFLLTIPNGHWLERLVLGGAGIVAVAFAATALALVPIRLSVVDVSLDQIPFLPLVVWAVATPMLAARVWAHLRFGNLDYSSAPAAPTASIGGMLAYLTLAGMAIGGIRVRDADGWETLVFVTAYSIGIGAIVVSYTALLLHIPYRRLWTIGVALGVLFVLAAWNLLVGHAVGSVGAELSIIAVTAANFHALFVLAFRLEREPTR